MSVGLIDVFTTSWQKQSFIVVHFGFIRQNKNVPHYWHCLTSYLNVVMWLRTYGTQPSLGYSHQTVNTSQIKSIKWSTHQLYRRILVMCSKNYGIILYRKGGDTLINFLWALGRHRLDNKDEFPFTSKPYQHQPNHERHLTEAGQIINSLIHVEIEETSNQKLTDDPTSFSWECSISTVDPLLWKILQLVTRTVVLHRQLHTAQQTCKSRYSQKEVEYLEEGVRRFGVSNWKAILKAYIPLTPSRAWST